MRIKKNMFFFYFVIDHLGRKVNGGDEEYTRLAISSSLRKKSFFFRRFHLPDCD